MRSNNIKWVYTSRKERARWIAEKYESFLKGIVLDVGCFNRFLKGYLPDSVEYMGIDIAGNPDRFVDLDKEGVPFDDNSFDCVVCSDVLEHIENIHSVFDDLIRVSRKYVIISLPNSWSVFKWNILKGGGELKFYGLPLEKPIDRHRWFFNYEQAVRFIDYRAKKCGAEVIETQGTLDMAESSMKTYLKRALFRNQMRRNNLFSLTVWSIIKVCP